MFWNGTLPQTHQDVIMGDPIIILESNLTYPFPCQLGGWDWNGPGIFLSKMPGLSLQNGLPGNSLY
jgi:hypothetical protein